ncbi:pilus assembly protein PilW [Pseudomonas taiwanensis]|uniref:PilW family protein n=1 Tax=Pseudomonas taiwanensis TaxID=470150 RepID=UPI0015BBB1D8|nr:PilW family protein [Pseudomonas taiwanensis]NWL75502.1 pilus assembly protein PilW [Pseudomonas taiwanensis]
MTCLNSRKAARGFGLIELMIAMLLGLLVTGSVLTLYLNISRSNDEMAKANEQIENGRFAMQVLQEDISHAGFWDGFVPGFDDLTYADSPSDVPASFPDPCTAFDSWTASDKEAVLGMPVQLLSSVPSGCTTIIQNRLAGTDILVVRHADTCVAGATGCDVFQEGRVYVQASACNTEGGLAMGDSAAELSLHKRNCTTIADRRRLISHIYYIRDFAVTAGDGIPTLVRSELDLAGGAVSQQPPLPLVEGVEGMKVVFKVDSRSDTGAAVNFAQAIDWQDDDRKDSPTNRGDGSPDETCPGVSACTLAQTINTVAVELSLLVRSIQPSPGYSSDKSFALAGSTLGPYTDSYKRHVYGTTVRLVNVSGRRETP